MGRSCPAKDRSSSIQTSIEAEVGAAGLQIYARVLTSGAISVGNLIKQLLHSDEWRGRFIEGRSRPEIVRARYRVAS